MCTMYRRDNMYMGRTGDIRYTIVFTETEFSYSGGPKVELQGHKP